MGATVDRSQAITCTYGDTGTIAVAEAPVTVDESGSVGLEDVGRIQRAENEEPKLNPASEVPVWQGGVGSNVQMAQDTSSVTAGQFTESPQQARDSSVKSCPVSNRSSQSPASDQEDPGVTQPRRLDISQLIDRYENG
jgi:hypothetical protein